MCGLVGMIAKTKSGFFTEEVNTFTQMLWADQLRGVHGTGVFYNNKKQEVYTYKDNVSASSLIQHKSWGKVEATVLKESSFVIGHNRHATKGAHTVENTHPFIEGDVVLVHNGTLTSHKHLADVEVDSRAIAIALDKEPDVQKVIDEVYGAYALIWHDFRTGKLNVLRNAERPLSWVETSKCIFIGSELDMVKWIVNRNKGTIIAEGKFETHTLYMFDVVTGERTSKPMIPTPKVVEKWNTYPTYYPANKPVKKSYFKGDKVEFIATDIITEGGIHYLAGVVEGATSIEDVDVRWYCKDMNLLDDLVYAVKLIGTVQSTVHKKDGSYYLLSHVRKEITVN